MLIDPAFRLSPGVLYPFMLSVSTAFAWCVSTGRADAAVLLASCAGTTLAARACLAAATPSRAVVATGAALVATLSLASAVTGEPGSAPGAWGLLPLFVAAAVSRSGVVIVASAFCAAVVFAAETSGVPLLQSMAGGVAAFGAGVVLATSAPPQVT